MKQEVQQKLSEEESRFMLPGRNNKEDRMNFVKYWAKYVRTHSDREWSRQQNMLINAQYPQIKGKHPKRRIENSSQGL